jgi:hypothetical protein
MQPFFNRGILSFSLSSDHDITSACVLNRNRGKFSRARIGETEMTYAATMTKHDGIAESGSGFFPGDFILPSN